MLENVQAPPASRPPRLSLIARAAVGCFGAMQKDAELERWLAVVEERRPGRLLVVGTASGGDVWALSRVAAPDAAFVTVDSLEYNQERGQFLADGRFANVLAGQSLVRIDGDSHDEGTICEVLEACPEYDFLLIDGDHSYEGALADWAAYSPLVRAGGLIVVHDIVAHPEELDCEVERLWRQLELGPHETRRIASHDGRAWAGVGIVEIAEAGAWVPEYVAR